MIKKLIVLMAVVGCGADVDYELTGENRVLLSVHPRAAKLARVIDRITYRDEIIEFVDTHGTDESGHIIPAITISRIFDGNKGSIVSKLQESSNTVLSAAEIWLAVTGREDAPVELLQEHLATVGNRRSSLEFLRIDVNEIERQSRPKSLTPAQFAALMNPSIPNHTHTNVRNDGVSIAAGDVKTRHTCSEVNPENNLNHIMLGDGLQKSDCFLVYFHGGWIRHGIGNDAAGQNRSIAASWCAGWRDFPDWFCVAPQVLNPDQYWIIDSNPNADAKAASFTTTVSSGGTHLMAIRVGSTWVRNNSTGI